MKSIKTSLVHNVYPPRVASEAKHPTLLMLHGRGADENDLAGLAPYLDDRLLVLSVRAPFPFPFGGYTWYDVGAIGIPEPGMFRTSYDKLSGFVNDALAGYPIDRKRLFLFGFSMGTVMSYALSLTRPELIRGVVANSGYIPEGTHLTLRWKDIGGVEFFVAHGTEDPVIPVTLARRARLLLEQAGAKFTYHEYPMSHEIGEKSLADLTSWLKQRIDT